MKNALIFCFLACVLVSFAHAEEFPPRKPGLWELTMTDEKGVQVNTMKQCTDTATDKQMMNMGNDMMSSMGSTCAKFEMKKEGDAYIANTDCNFSGSRMVSKTVTKGDFDSAYSSVSSVTYDPPFMGMSKGSVKIDAKWLGACSGDQKPGDIIMSNGMKTSLSAMKDFGKSMPKGN